MEYGSSRTERRRGELENSQGETGPLVPFVADAMARGNGDSPPPAGRRGSWSWYYRGPRERLFEPVLVGAGNCPSTCRQRSRYCSADLSRAPRRSLARTIHEPPAEN